MLRRIALLTASLLTASLLGCSDGAQPGFGGFGGSIGEDGVGTDEGGSEPSSNDADDSGGSASASEGSTQGSMGSSGTSGDEASATTGTEASSDETASAGETGTTTTSDDAGSSTSGSETDDGAESSSDDGDPLEPPEVDACGFPLDGPWLLIEYWQAGGSPQSPDWTFSDSPGWGAAQWATTGETHPEVWDVYDNISVGNDPIGVLAIVGGSSVLQIMIGLTDLIDYDHATVCVEGRSASATASVQFDVYNPLNDCGVSTTMAHDWSMHAAGVDLGDCLVPGAGVQAIRLEPTGGSSTLGVRRVRVALHGATY